MQGLGAVGRLRQSLPVDPLGGTGGRRPESPWSRSSLSQYSVEPRCPSCLAAFVTHLTVKFFLRDCSLQHRGETDAGVGRTVV